MKFGPCHRNDYQNCYAHRCLRTIRNNILNWKQIELELHWKILCQIWISIELNNLVSDFNRDWLELKAMNWSEPWTKLTTKWIFSVKSVPDLMWHFHHKSGHCIKFPDCSAEIQLIKKQTRIFVNCEHPILTIGEWNTQLTMGYWHWQ